MIDEVGKRDKNFVVVVLAVTDDGNQYITQLRLHPVTKGLVVTEKRESAVNEANGAAGAGLTILAAGGAGIKNRIFKIILTSDTVATLTLSDGFGVYYGVVGCPPIVLDYGSIGKLQTTANTAITVTSGVAANVGVLVLYTTE